MSSMAGPRSSSKGSTLPSPGHSAWGTSTIDPATGLLTQGTFAPTSDGACDDAGAGPVPLAANGAGVRSCDDVVAYITQIPVESGGPLIANIVAFRGDGSGVGMSGRAESSRLDQTLDASQVDCGPLPPVRVPVTATPNFRTDPGHRLHHPRLACYREISALQRRLRARVTHTAARGRPQASWTCTAPPWVRTSCSSPRPATQMSPPSSSCPAVVGATEQPGGRGRPTSRRGPRVRGVPSGHPVCRRCRPHRPGAAHLRHP